MVAYYVSAVTGEPVMLQRAHNPSSRAELEQVRAKREERQAAQAAAAKARQEERLRALR